MKISRGLVKTYLALFLLVILMNIVCFFIGYYQSWMGDTFLGFFIFFWVLFLRKKFNARLEKYRESQRVRYKNIDKRDATKKQKYRRNALLQIFSIIILALVIGGLILAPNFIGKFPTIIVFLTIFLIVGLTSFILHSIYDKSTKVLKSSVALAISYALITINIFLSPKIYSLEWAFLGFIMIAVVFYDFKIDSRFLILPAILLLGYIPFLLMISQQAMAENMAVFIYYFLVVGVLLQLVEYYKDVENRVDFSLFFKNLMKYREKILNILSVWGIVTIILIILNRFKSLELIKWSAIYVFIILLIFYLVSGIIEDKEPTQKRQAKVSKKE